MGGMFSKPSSPKIPPQEKVEEIQKVEDDANEEQQRARKKIANTSGRQSTMLAGISNALKTRLGE